MKPRRQNKGTYVVPTGPNDAAKIVSASGHVHVFTAQHAKCDLCGKMAELRPYGPNEENICYECAMKDEKTTAKQFGRKFK